MIHDQSILLTLQKLGLTYYGAKAFVALMNTGVTNPSVIAEESGIPRTKIYEVLKKLAADNWIIIEKGRPAIVTPRYPGEIIQEKKSIIDNDINGVSTELSMTYDKVLENETPKVNIIHCLDTITQLTAKMMSGARERIMLMGSLYFLEEINVIKEEITRAKDRGVSVRIVTMPSQELDDKIHILKNLSEATSDIKIGHPYFIKSLIIDDRETLLMIARIKNNIPDLENVVAINISNVSLTSYFSSVFNMEWKNLKFYDESKVQL